MLVCNEVGIVGKLMSSLLGLSGITTSTAENGDVLDCDGACESGGNVWGMFNSAGESNATLLSSAVTGISYPLLSVMVQTKRK